MVPCKSPVQGWGSVCGELFLTTERVCCGEADRILILGPANIALVAVAMFRCHR